MISWTDPLVNIIFYNLEDIICRQHLKYSRKLVITHASTRMCFYIFLFPDYATLYT